MGMRVIAPMECWETVCEKWWWQYGESFDSDSTFRCGGFTVKAFPNRTQTGKWLHNNSDGSECPCYGYWIYHPEMGRLVYASDTECIVQRFKNINHFLLGTNYSKELIDPNSGKYLHQVRGHMSIETACDFLKANSSEQLQNVIFCHLSGEGSDEEDFKARAQSIVNCPIIIAKKGTEIDLTLK